MKREEMIDRIQEKSELWDIIIIGGGATGMGAAVEAASRGYKTLLLEQSDFGKGTSSRSTKLIHGGVRYLKQGNVSLVLESLKERGILRRNAPHLVHNLPFIVPNYDWWEGPFYGVGLKLYDMLAGKEGFGASKILSKEKTLELLPTVEMDGLNCGVIYYDGQFDDARLVINLAKTSVEQGATVINYAKVSAFTKKNNLINGVIVEDIENDKEYELKAKVIINATGVFSDDVRKLDDPDIITMLQPSQGVHIILDKSFLPGETAIMVPHTDDGRVLFAIPWHDSVVVGTTETPIGRAELEPSPQPEELEFLISHIARYLSKDPKPTDVLSAFAGLRPLVGSADLQNTATISRDHTINISSCGLVTIAGGKWTTYRKMGEDTIDQAALIAELPTRLSVTSNLNIHGFHNNTETLGEFAIYGSDAYLIQDLIDKNKDNQTILHPKMPIKAGEVVWAVREEMARTVEDFLSRRRRCLLLNAKVSIEMANFVSEIMANEMRKNRKWRKKQVVDYNNMAMNYCISST